MDEVTVETITSGYGPTAEDLNHRLNLLIKGWEIVVDDNYLPEEMEAKIAVPKSHEARMAYLARETVLWFRDHKTAKRFIRLGDWAMLGQRAMRIRHLR